MHPNGHRVMSPNRIYQGFVGFCRVVFEPCSTQHASAVHGKQDTRKDVIYTIFYIYDVIAPDQDRPCAYHRRQKQPRSFLDKFSSDFLTRFEDGDMRQITYNTYMYTATSRILQLQRRFCVTDRAGVQPICHSPSPRLRNLTCSHF